MMTATPLPPSPAAPSLAEAAHDYDMVRAALELMGDTWRDQPEVETIARRLGVSSRHLARLFERWAGISPKAFLQALTLDAAERLLKDSASVLDATFELGLSGPSRLHDLFVSHHAVPPGIFRAKGRGLAVTYGFHPSPFGEALVMATSYGLAGLAFADPERGGRAAALDDMIRRWPEADFNERPEETAPFAARVFEPQRWRADQPLRVVLIGSDFQIRVWETLLTIPMGRATTYSAIAGKVCSPKAARAVGAAVGANPISFVVPCHRVIGKSGALTGYHWGLTRKRAILGWEAGRVG